MVWNIRFIQDCRRRLCPFFVKIDMYPAIEDIPTLRFASGKCTGFLFGLFEVLASLHLVAPLDILPESDHPSLAQRRGVRTGPTLRVVRGGNSFFVPLCRDAVQIQSKGGMDSNFPANLDLSVDL